MTANQVNRTSEQFLKKCFQSEHKAHPRRHIDAYIHIAVRPVVTSRHRAEYT